MKFYMCKILIFFSWMWINLFPQDISAHFSPPLSYSFLVKYAEKVVKGKIVNRKRFTTTFNGTKISCGWILDIEVSKSWKGKSENFSIHTQGEKTFNGKNIEYFIIARRTAFGNKEIGFKNQVVCPKGRSVTVPESIKYMTRTEQMIFPIDDYLQKSIGEEWLRIVPKIVGGFDFPAFKNTPIMKGKEIHSNYPVNHELINLSQFLNAVNLTNINK